MRREAQLGAAEPGGLRTYQHPAAGGALLQLRRDKDLQALAEDLAGIEICAPMRLDGELIRPDGAAVKWREFRLGVGEILVKTLGGVALLERSQFPQGEIRS